MQCMHVNVGGKYNAGCLLLGFTYFEVLTVVFVREMRNSGLIRMLSGMILLKCIKPHEHGYSQNIAYKQGAT